jgi:hypothetical protein
MSGQARLYDISGILGLVGPWFGPGKSALNDGYVPTQVTAPEISDLWKVFTLKGKFLSDPKFAFTLQAYANDTPASNILPKEANRVLQSIIDY